MRVLAVLGFLALSDAVILDASPKQSADNEWAITRGGKSILCKTLGYWRCYCESGRMAKYKDLGGEFEAGSNYLVPDIKCNTAQMASWKQEHAAELKWATSKPASGGSSTSPVSSASSAPAKSASSAPVISAPVISAPAIGKVSSGSVSAPALSSAAELSSLVTSTAVSLTEVVAKPCKVHQIHVPYSVDKLSLTPTATTTTAKVEVNGDEVPRGQASPEVSLIVGSPVTMRVVVIAQDGVNRKGYEVEVIRDASSVASLSSLVTSDGQTLPLDASAAIQDIKVNVRNEVDKLSLTPTATEGGPLCSGTQCPKILVNGAPVTSGSASVEVTLTAGSETLLFVLVTAQDKVTQMIYKVFVTRALPVGGSPLTPAVGPSTPAVTVSNEARLQRINGLQGTMSPYPFNPDQTQISLKLKPKHTQFGVGPVAMDGTKATIKVDGSDKAPDGTPFNLGGLKQFNGFASLGSPREVQIVVTAEDNVATKTYKLTVSRAASDEARLDHVFVGPFRVCGATLLTTKENVVTVNNVVDKVSVKPTARDPTATITVDGTPVTSGSASADKPLTAGTPWIFDLVVTAPDGTVNTYRMKVVRAKSSEALLSSLVTSDGQSLKGLVAGPFPVIPVDVPNSVNKLSLTPTAKDRYATITVDGTTVTSGSASAEKPLTAGSPVDIIVEVTAPDTVTKVTYRVVVTQAALNYAELSRLTYTTKSIWDGKQYDGFDWIRGCNNRECRSARENKYKQIMKYVFKCRLDSQGHAKKGACLPKGQDRGYKTDFGSGPRNFAFQHIDEMIEQTRHVLNSQIEAKESALDLAGRPVFTAMRLRVTTSAVADIMKDIYDGIRAGKQIALMNAASEYQAGGGFATGGRHALEEAICSASTLFLSLVEATPHGFEERPPNGSPRHMYHSHIDEHGVVYSPHVEVFRGTTGDGYQVREHGPQKLSAVVSPAMYNINPENKVEPWNYPLATPKKTFAEEACNDPGWKTPLGSPSSPRQCTTPTIDCNPPTCKPGVRELYIEGTRKKIRAALHAAALSGANTLYVPAIGAGLFGNSPEFMARTFAEVLFGKANGWPSYNQYFREIVFPGFPGFPFMEKAKEYVNMGPSAFDAVLASHPDYR